MDRMLLRVSEVAEITGMGRSKTYQLIMEGKIPSVKVGRSVRVPAERLRRWVDGLQLRMGASNNEQAEP